MVLGERKRQVELCGVMSALQRFDFQARQLQRHGGSVVQTEHDLEYRAVTHASGRLQSADHLFERQVLMIERRQGLVFDLF